MTHSHGCEGAHFDRMPGWHALTACCCSSWCVAKQQAKGEDKRMDRAPVNGTRNWLVQRGRSNSSSAAAAADAQHWHKDDVTEVAVAVRYPWRRDDRVKTCTEGLSTSLHCRFFITCLNIVRRSCRHASASKVSLRSRSMVASAWIWWSQCTCKGAVCASDSLSNPNNRGDVVLFALFLS
jgi:hypothetical protein